MEEEEKYLGGLVVKVAEIEGLTESGQFLDKVGLDVKEVCIQQTIIRELPLDLLPNEDLYVFTPKEAFRYHVKNGHVSSLGSRKDGFAGKGTLDEAVEHLAQLAIKQPPIRIHALFFDEASKREFLDRIRGTGIGPHMAEDLYCKGYGAVVLHHYIKHQITFPTK